MWLESWSELDNVRKVRWAVVADHEQWLYSVMFTVCFYLRTVFIPLNLLWWALTQPHRCLTFHDDLSMTDDQTGRIIQFQSQDSLFYNQLCSF